MAIRTLQAGPLRVRAVGPEGSGPAVVLCHGFGAPGEDLVPLAEALDAGSSVRWFFPEAPLDLRMMGVPGRAWWLIDMMRLQMAVVTRDVEGLLRETPQGLADARSALESCLAALEKEHAVHRSKLILGGFSQGAMLSTELALHAATPFAGLVVLSGSLISAERWQASVKTTGPSLKVLQSHGRADPILPFVAGQKLRDLLVGAGAQLEFIEHGGGHEIPMNVLQRLSAFVRQMASAES